MVVNHWPAAEITAVGDEAFLAAAAISSLEVVAAGSSNLIVVDG